MAIPFLKGIDVSGAVDLSNLTIDGAQGTDGQVLTSTGSGIAWEDASGGASLSGGAANKLAIWNSATTLTNDTNLHWDTSNDRLGIGTDSPTRKLTILDSTGSRLALIGGSTTNCNILFGDTTDDNKGSIRFDNSNSSFEHRASIFNFKAFGSSALYINSLRNVGIGTTSPNRPLVVSETRTGSTASDAYTTVVKSVQSSGASPNPGTGGLKVQYTSSSSNVHAFGLVAGSSSSDFLTTGPMHFYTNSDLDTVSATGFAMQLDTSQRLILGSMTASQKLNVSGNVLASRYYSTPSSGNYSTQYYIDPNDGTTSAVLNGDVAIGDFSTPAHRLVIRTPGGESGNTEDGVFIKSPFAGGSAITTDAQPFLAIGCRNTSGGVSRIFLGQNATATSQESLIEYSRDNGTLGVFVKGMGTYTEHVRFGNQSSGTARTRFYGNVGIGTNPSTKLHVNDGHLRIDNYGGTDNYYLEFYESGSQRFRIYENANNVYFDGGPGNTHFRPRQGGGSNNFIVTGANVGIGETNPGSPLHVAGDIQTASGSVKIADNWGQGFYSAEQLSIVGSYPSIALRNNDSNQDNKWLIHHDGNDLTFYAGANHANTSWAKKVQVDSGNQGMGAKIFYDLDSSGYYLDPGSSSVALNINGKIAQAKEDYNIDSSHPNAIFQAARATQTDRGSWPGSYYYGVNFGDRTKGIQLAAAYSSAKNLYFRSGTDNSNSENGANTWKNWRQLFHDDYHPNADKWTTARTITLAGDLSGSVSIDGSANVTLTASVNDDSHDLTWANIDGETANSVNGWGGLRHQTNDGYIDFGPANVSHAHIYTDRPNFYFNKELRVNNHQVFHQDYHPNADTWTTARTITIGSTGKSVNGSGNVSWTLSEIGAAAAGDENIIDGALSIWNADGDGDVLTYNDSNPVHNGKTVGAVVNIKGDGSEIYSLLRAGIYTGDHISVSRGYYVGSELNTSNANTTQVINSSGYWSSYPVFPYDSFSKTDISTRTETGFYQDSSPSSGEGWPALGGNTSWAHLISCTHSNNSNYYAMQLSASFYNQNLYYRSTAGSGSTGWSKMWSDQNDGAGSGLDADTVDGIQAASFLRNDTGNTTNGTPLTVTSSQSVGAIIQGGNNSNDIIQLKNSSAQIEAKLDTNGNWHVDADVVAYSTSTASDKKLKTNISTLTNALDKTIKLRGVNFDWIDENKPNNQVGFIAQEVEKVLPEVVKNVETLNKENETHKAVDYAAVVPLLVEAIKEQQKQIDELKSIINGSS